jgi:serine/threonine-protein kinase
MAIEVAFAHRDRPLPPLPPAVPGEVAALVAELTAKDPAARPAAAEAALGARCLRDAMTAGATFRLGTQPGAPTAALPTAQPETLARFPSPTLADAHPGTPEGMGLLTQTPPGRPLPGRAGTPWRTAAAVIGVIAAAVVLPGVLLASLPGPAPSQGAARPPGRPSAARSTAARTVEVSGGALAGQPVTAVARQLRRLGLAVRVRWRPSGQQPPGTVLAVQPSGQVPIGSTIAVTGALPAGPKDKRAPKSHGKDEGTGKHKGH